jgi:hypothetical protein
VNNIIPFGAVKPHARPAARQAQPQAFVVFTSVDATLDAVRAAHDLARPMGFGVTVVHFRPVSYAVALESPIGTSPAESGEFAERMQSEGVPAEIRVCLCRSEREAAATVIPPQSLVVVGGRRAWWPTPASRWQRMLESLGHRVVLVDGTRDRRDRPNHQIGQSRNHQINHQITKSPDHQMSGERARA